MPWIVYLAVAFTPGAGEPVNSSDPAALIVSKVLGYGLLGVLVIVLAWVLYKGSFIPEKRVAEQLAAARADLLKENERIRAETAHENERIRAETARAVEAGRADLLREITTVREEKQKAETERDAALNVAQVQLVPLLTSFVATSQSLIPLLQELVRNRER